MSEKPIPQKTSVSPTLEIVKNTLLAVSVWTGSIILMLGSFDFTLRNHIGLLFWAPHIVSMLSAYLLPIAVNYWGDTNDETKGAIFLGVHVMLWPYQMYLHQSYSTWS